MDSVTKNPYQPSHGINRPVAARISFSALGNVSFALSAALLVVTFMLGAFLVQVGLFHGKDGEQLHIALGQIMVGCLMLGIFAGTIAMICGSNKMRFWTLALAALYFPVIREVLFDHPMVEKGAAWFISQASQF